MSKSGLHTCLLLAAMIIALLASACRHHTGVENAYAVKASVLANLRADTTADARKFYARIDSCPLRTAHDCEVFYSIVSDVTEYMGIHGNSLDASIIMRNILDILLESDNRTPQDTRQMLTMYVHLGSLFTDMGMPNIGIDYYMTGLKYCRDSVYDDFKAMLCNNMGILYAQRSQVERAEEYFRKALEINQNKNNHHATFINYGNLTELYALQGETQKALETSLRIVEDLDHINTNSHQASMSL
ncbi:MAG: tetratricopeptide repeat protein, partial [Muribaculaceae bacterium]|nr:tetratricopeptide repeat protein [Muribaculaceae bacterium]